MNVEIIQFTVLLLIMLVVGTHLRFETLNDAEFVIWLLVDEVLVIIDDDEVEPYAVE